MKIPKRQNFSSYEEYQLAMDKFNDAVKQGNKQAIMSKRNYEARIYENKIKYERWKAMQESKIFADGLKVTEKVISDDFKIIKLGIKADKFMEFLAKHTNDRGYVNIDLKTSKNGGYYAELNTYNLNLSNEDVMKFNEEVEEVEI